MNDNLKKIYDNLKFQSKLKEAGICSIQGPQGPAGPATIKVGTTTTGNPGTNASVVNAGTDENVILNFTIPSGLTGATGRYNKSLLLFF